jgi:hypothetical protein
VFARSARGLRGGLPGGSGSLVLVTSRRRLSGLDEADHLSLDTLPPHEAAGLFRAVAGRDRDAGDKDTVDEIVRLCGYMPLAVRIAAARLRTDRSHTLTGRHLLAQLRTGQHTDRLAALTEGDRSVAWHHALEILTTLDASGAEDVTAAHLRTHLTDLDDSDRGLRRNA